MINHPYNTQRTAMVEQQRENQGRFVFAWVLLCGQAFQGRVLALNLLDYLGNGDLIVFVSLKDQSTRINSQEFAQTMENSSYILATSQRALRQRLEVISNNIANMNTPGFKADRATFRDVLSRSDQGRREYYTQTQGTFTDFRDGAMTPTANQFDVALGQDGFLAIDTPAGERYTRAGRLQMNADRQLVTSSGDLVQGQGGVITIPEGATRVLINQDGSITANNQNIDRLRVVRFEDKAALQKTYGNMYVAAAEPVEMESPNVLQGMLEASNVQAIAEVTEMMSVLRSYQSVSKAVEKEDGRVKKMIAAYTKK